MSKDLRLQVILSAVDKFTKPFKSAQASNKKMAEALRQSKQQLKELNNQAKQIDGFKKTKQSLDSASQAYQQATAKVSRLARELSTVQNPTRAQSRELDRAKAAAAKLKAETGTLSASLQRQREALRGSGISTRQLSQAQIKLNSDIASTSRRLQQQEQQLKRVANQEKRMSAAKNSYQNAMGVRNKMAGSGVGMLASGVGLGYAAKKVLVPGYDFEIGMSKVQALTRLDKNSDDYKMLREQARDLGATTAFTANEVAQGQAFYAMAGFKPEQIKNAMSGTLSMSLAGDIDLATTADIGSNILTGFKLNSNEMNRVSDALVATFTRSNTNLTMLGDTMKYVAPVASGLGVDLETAAVAAGKLGDAGIQGSMAGTGLRSILGRLAEPPKMAGEALDKLKIKTRDAKGNLRQFTDILAELDKKTKKMGTAERAGLFKHIAGEEAFSALSVLVDQAGSGQLQAMIAEIKAAKGEAEKVAKTMTDNLDGDLKNLTSAYEDVGIQVFGGADSPLRDITKRVTNLISKFGQWAKKNPELVKQITMITLGLGAVLAVGGGITLMIAALIGPLAMAKLSLSVLGIKGSGFLSLLIKPIKLIGTAFMMLGRALLANPIILIITAIAGAAYLIYKYWDDIVPYAKKLWNRVTEIFSQFWEGVKSYVLNWGLVGLVYQHWDEIVAITSRMWALVKKTISDKWDQIVADVKGLPERFKQIGGEIIDSLKNGILEKWEALKAQFAELKQMATNILPDWMLSDETKTVRAMSQVTVIQAGMKNAGMFDSGGFIPRGQFGIAGEKAPEIVTGPAHITSRRKTAALAAAALSMGSMTATAKPIHPYALPANSYQSAPTTINQSNHAANTAPVTINVYPLPHQSANDIAREVAKQLAQNQQREQARRLSRYQDSEDD
ncbi:phage tail tape measure protein [Providencia rettgeri]|uniref:Phage tail tape measure protein n=1 Tax=Providencia rettgeri TaxID=587 RepID=A0AAP2JXY8_PRORE|nr:phage tail tape measure protein [Providencia rettgeri]ELR5199348.1 phage tail tape measure protein [Providencia rettgeri]MBX6952999.1 phage tail tape measure protein [Providencia rettgeri]MBX6954966.1 phage tail tape measure protein [Providencia rettgeri]MBX6958953.1 phage tail tape measure protein [Providencia rettgeri]MBX6971874.1 phage tail tape measure protein [Providencia rettgeri]